MFRDSWSNFFGNFAPQQSASVTINGVPHNHHHHTSFNSQNSSANRSNNRPSSSSHNSAQPHSSRPSHSRRNSSNSHQHSSSRNNSNGSFTFGINLDQIMDEVEESINSTIDGFTTSFAFGGRHRPSRSRTTSSSSSSRSHRESGARPSSNHHSSASSQHEHARRRHRADHDRIRREHARSHARRHGHNSTRQSTEQKRGLTEDQIKRLRKHEFTKQDDECTICMDDFVMSYVVRTLPCKHYFHSDCIDPWLRRNASCPTCRAAVVIPS